jgi:hypothetical protein
VAGTILGSAPLFAEEKLAAAMGGDAKVLTKRPGKEIVFSVPASQEEGRKPWRHLQRLQVHLDELDVSGQVQLLGCETNVPTLDCEAVKTATRSNDPKGIEGVTTLTYSIYDGEWNGGVKKLLTDALKRTNDDEIAAKKQAAVEVKMVATPKTFTEEPACSQYASPCYSRAVCTMYAGCSKSTLSCVQCNY